MRPTFVVAVCLLVAAPVSAAPPIECGDWDELWDLSRLPYLRSSVCQQVSSFDRTGGNDDGFSGQYSFIRMEADKFVIFDESGPGCIYRLWSANPGPGAVRFYFDGETEPRITVEHFEDLFLDKVDPFRPPFSKHFIGGWVSYVPIPFRKSLKIVADGPVRFLQITWRRFAHDEGVESFDPMPSEKTKAKMARAAEALRSVGKPPAPLAPATTLSVNVGPRESAELFAAEGAGVLQALRLRFDSPDARIWRKAVLQILVDGTEKPNVWCPVGDFFLNAFGNERLQSLAVGRLEDGTWYCYLPMPHAAGIRVAVTNESDAPLKVEGEAAHQALQSLPEGMGRFFAWWHRQNPTTLGELFPTLEATGRGHFCGVSHAMQGGGGLGFLEGDEMMWVDDRDNTHYNGTGTEDYFNGGWYFGQTGWQAYYGCGYLSDEESRCHAFRLQLTDLVPFQSRIRAGIEHGPGNDVQADYAGVTYWYAAPGTTHNFAPAPVSERMVRSPSLPGAIEAERALISGPEATAESDAALPYQLSGGAGAFSTSKGTGAAVPLAFDVGPTDVYGLEALLVPGPDKGLIAAALDDTPLGDNVDAYAAKPTGTLSHHYGWRLLGPGRHELSLFSCGKNAEGTGSAVGVDAIFVRPSPKEAGVLEAESLPVLAASGYALGTEAVSLDWSGLRQLCLDGERPDAFVTLGVSTDLPTAYDVRARFTKSPDGGMVQAAMDGLPLGALIDTYAPERQVAGEVSLGTTNDLAPGPHLLTLRGAGKRSASSGYRVGVDYLRLVPLGLLEGEQLRIVEYSGEPLDIQPMSGFGRQWSGEGQLWFRPTQPGAFVTVEVNVKQAGPYHLYGCFTMANDYGILQLLVDGQPVGKPFDGYSPTVVRSELVDFGEIELAQGPHQFRLQVAGKNQASTSYMVGLDCLLVRSLLPREPAGAAD